MRSPTGRLGELLQRVPATALAVAGMLSVQFGNGFIGSLFERVTPFGAAALRLGFAAVLLLAVVRPRVRRWDRRTWLGVALLGVGMAGMNTSIYLAIDRIPFGIAITIELMGPLAVAALGARRLVDALWVLLALGGIALFGITGGGTVTVAGVGFALLAGAFWATYILASARVTGRVRGLDGLAVAIAVAAVVVVPIGAGDAVRAATADPALLLAFLAAAVLTSVVPYALDFIALRRIPTRVFGVLSSLSPAIAALAGLVLLGQWLTPIQLVAMALVIVASAGVVLTARR